jgi:hypothetical protein
MRENIQDAIKNSVLVETPKTFNMLVQLVPKANGDMRLLVDMRDINQFIVQ